MAYARVVDGKVKEVIKFDPSGRYPSDYVWVECPDDTQQKATYNGSVFTNPVEPEPVMTEPVPTEPNYRPLSFVEFITLVQVAGGMTDEKAVEVLATSTNASIILLRIKLEKAGDAIERDNQAVLAGLGTLQAANFIGQAGHDAILAAWPTE